MNQASANKPLVICLMGPTASGKTNLACKLAQVLPLEIISVDSAMIYRGMDIGTATPSESELQRHPHSLINFLDPAESYSAADFCHDAKREITRIIEQGKIPILVGGTMLYFKALQQGLSQLPSADETIRESILQQAKSDGWQALHAKLAQVDPISAARIKSNDKQRIQRALEIHAITGKPMSSLMDQTTACEKYHYLNIGLMPSDRGRLHDLIAKRFARMMDEGFLEEVKRLHERGDLNPDLPAIRAVGYRQAFAYLDAKINLDELYEKAIAATRQLAKRQITWLRSFPDCELIDIDKVDAFEETKRLLETKSLF